MYRKAISLVVVLVVLTQVVPALANANDQVRIDAGGDTSECELESPNEWHWVINQVDPPSRCPGEIYINWSDGEETVPLQKVTGKTCHYVTSSHGWEPNVYLGAYAFIDPSWVEGNGQFVLSHRPCEEEEPEPQPTCLSASGEPSKAEVPYWYEILEVEVRDPDGLISGYTVRLDGDETSVTNPVGWETQIVVTGTHTIEVGLVTEEETLYFEACKMTTQAEEAPEEPEPAVCKSLSRDGDEVTVTLSGDLEAVKRVEIREGSKIQASRSWEVGKTSHSFVIKDAEDMDLSAWIILTDGGELAPPEACILEGEDKPWFTSVGFGVFCEEAGGNWTPLDGEQHGAFITATLEGPSTVPVWKGQTGVDGMTTRYEARINTVTSLTSTNSMGYPHIGFYELAHERPSNWLENPGSAAWPVSFPQSLSAEGDYKTFVGLFDCRNGDQEDEEVVPYLGPSGTGETGELVGELVFIKEGRELGRLPVYEGDSLASLSGQVNLRDGRFYVHEPDIRHLLGADEVIVYERDNVSHWQMPEAPTRTAQFGETLGMQDDLPNPKIVTCAPNWSHAEVWELQPDG